MLLQKLLDEGIMIGIEKSGVGGEVGDPSEKCVEFRLVRCSLIRRSCAMRLRGTDE